MEWKKVGYGQYGSEQWSSSLADKYPLDCDHVMVRGTDKCRWEVDHSSEGQCPQLKKRLERFHAYLRKELENDR
jgi:hypothetical protein